MRVKKGNEKVDLLKFRNRVEKVTNNAKQNDIEEMCGFKYGELSKIYGGHAALTIDHLIKLSDAYHCGVDYLLGRDDMSSNSFTEFSAYNFINTIALARYYGVVQLSFENSTFTVPGSFECVDIPVNVIRITNSKMNDYLTLYVNLVKAASNTGDLGKKVLEVWMDGIKEENPNIQGSDLIEKH